MLPRSLTAFDGEETSAFYERPIRQLAEFFSARESTLEPFSRQWLRVQLSLRSYLTSLLFERAAVDDCLQEVALLAWRKGPKDLDDRAFLAWCIACAKRVGANEIRRKTRSRLRLLPPDLMDALADAVAEAELQEPTEAPTRLAALRTCLERLDPRQRRLLEIRYASKKPADLKKQAGLLGRSMDAIYKRLERLRAVLRACVEKSLDSPE